MPQIILCLLKSPKSQLDLKAFQIKHFYPEISKFKLCIKYLFTFIRVLVWKEAVTFSISSICFSCHPFSSLDHVIPHLFYYIHPFSPSPIDQSDVKHNFVHTLLCLEHPLIKPCASVYICHWPHWFWLVGWKVVPGSPSYPIKH